MAQNTKSGGGGTTLIDGTAYKINFAPSEYIMTLTGSGGTITYNGVTQTTTFRVAAGDSIICTANATGMLAPAIAKITLNGVVVAREQGDGRLTATYTYEPKANATIKMTKNRTENFCENATIDITETS